MDDITDRLRTLGERSRLTHMAIRREAADEIERLRAIIRVNGLRNGATHAEIDAMLKRATP